MWPTCQPMDRLAGSVPGRGLLPGWTSQNSLISGPSSFQIQSGPSSYRIHSGPISYQIQSGPSSYQIQSGPSSYQIQSGFNADECLPIDLPIARRDRTGQDCREYIFTACYTFDSQLSDLRKYILLGPMHFALRTCTKIRLRACFLGSSNLFSVIYVNTFFGFLQIWEKVYALEEA